MVLLHQNRATNGTPPRRTCMCGCSCAFVCVCVVVVAVAVLVAGCAFVAVADQCVPFRPSSSALASANPLQRTGRRDSRHTRSATQATRPGKFKSGDVDELRQALLDSETKRNAMHHQLQKDRKAIAELKTNVRA